MTSATRPTPVSLVPARLQARGLEIPLGLGAVKLLVHLALIGRYGYHRDELYFIQCAEHLDLGYVDHAPLVPWIARLFGEPFGYDMVALRFPAVLAGAAVVVLTAVLAKNLGGDRFAQLLAGLCALAAPAYMRMAKMLCIPIFEQLFWVVAALLLVHIAAKNRPRMWLALGVVAGLGLLNKHSMLMWGAGAFVGTLLTPSLRRHLRTPWPWLGAALAFVIFLPNLLWQASHEWATVEFLHNMSTGLLSHVPRSLFVAGNVLYMNPLTLPVWGAGLWFFFSREGATHRALGWIFVTAFVALLVTHGKPYYLAPAFPALFAGGGVWLSRRLASTRTRMASAGALVASAVLLAPVGLPLLPLFEVDEMVGDAVGFVVEPELLTHDLHDEFGWREQAESVAAVHASLPAHERNDALVLAGNYGQASAITHFGEEHGLPPAASGHMAWHHWGLPRPEPSVVIAYGFRPETLDRLFLRCEVAGATHHPLAMDYENVPIHVCRDLRVPLTEAWPSLRRWYHGPPPDER